MEQQILITMTPEDLLDLVKKGIREVEKEKLNQVSPGKSYSINRVAKALGRSHTTIKRLIVEGKLISTCDGKRITAQALNDYLKKPG